MDYHSLWAAFHRALEDNRFGDVELVDVFSGHLDAPFQFALRDKLTGRVKLVDFPKPIKSGMLQKQRRHRVAMEDGSD